jgi:Na+/melibiose symporter-like transporter
MIVSYVGFIPGALIGIVPTVFLTGDFSYSVVLGIFLGICISFYILSLISIRKMPESREMYELKKENTENNDINTNRKEKEEKIIENTSNLKLRNESCIPTTEHLTLKESFRQTIKSQPFRYIVIYRFCACFFQGIYYQNLIYMLNWVVPAYGLWSIAISGVGGLIINGLYPFLTKWRKKIGHVQVLKICFIIGIPGYIVMFLATNLWLLMLGYSLTTVTLSGLYLFDPVLMGDVADDDFIKTGNHKQGIFCSVHGFFTTMAYSVAIFLLTFFLELYGYDGKADFQSESTIMGIRITVTLMPAIAVLLCILILTKYPLQGKRYKELRFKLADVHGESMLENDSLLREYREIKNNIKNSQQSSF